MRPDFGDGIILGILITWCYLGTYFETLYVKGKTQSDAIVAGLGSAFGFLVGVFVIVAVFRLLFGW